MKDDQKNPKWKTTKKIKMPNQNKFKLEDDQNKFKWKTTKKIKMEDNQKRFK